MESVQCIYFCLFSLTRDLCSCTFQRHLRITKFRADLRNSLLHGEEMVKRYSLPFFYCYSVFQAVVCSRLSAYRGKAKFIINISLLEEMQKVS